MHRPMWRYGSLLSLLGGVLLCLPSSAGVAVGGRSPQISGPPDASVGGYSRPSQQMGKEPAAPDPMAAHNASKLEHMREDERRKRLQADATRLVELSNALKSAVDNTSRDELSLDVVRRAAEIEKVAHDLKERMRS